jgi:hypothetical protein
MASKFVEILDAPENGPRKMSESDVKLEDVLADHEATVNRSRSSTQSSSKSNSDKEPSPAGRDDQPSCSSSSSLSSSPTTSTPRLKRLRKFTLTGGLGR